MHRTGPVCNPFRAPLSAALLTLALGAAPVRAQDSDIAWNTCFGSGGASDITLQCDAGTPPAVLYLTFTGGGTVATGIEFALDLEVDAGALPPFWAIQTPLSPTLCNGGAEVRCGNDIHCAGYASPFIGCLAVLLFQQDPVKPWRAQLQGIVQLPPGEPPVLLGLGGRYVACTIAFDPSWATESGGSCDGCTTPARIGPPAGQSSGVVTLETPDGARVLASQTCVTVNGGGSLSCTTTPTRPSTWGRVKALYR